MNKGIEHDKYDNFFKAKIKNKLENILSKMLMVSPTLFLMKHMFKQLLRVSIKILPLVLI